jgi:hypothetical protein
MITVIENYWSIDHDKEKQSLPKKCADLPPLPPSPEPDIALHKTIVLIYYPTSHYDRVYDNPVWIEKITEIEQLVEKFYPVVTCCIKNPDPLTNTHIWIHLTKNEFVASCEKQEKIIPYNSFGSGSVFGSFATPAEYFEATTHTSVFDRIHELMTNLNQMFRIDGSLNICLMSPEPVDDEHISHDWYLSKI